MGIKVVKFGGSSLADAGQIIKVCNIIRADKERRYVVPSAPGKRFDGDEKITDLLYRLQSLAASGEDAEPVYKKISDRFEGIINDLGMDYALPLEKVKNDILNGASPDYAASRGEYLNGLILAEYLGYEFVDAAEIICFDENGNFLAEETNAKTAERLKNIANAVIPGFYGSYPDGRVKTFSRGGSDITGSIVARAVGADLYENWTDVSGFMVADPRIVKEPKCIRLISYTELRELSYMGASVLHEDAIFPVSKAKIPINIKNTNDPENKGTMIVAEKERSESFDVVTGIAGRKGFTVITISKSMMNAEIGLARKMLSALEKYNISFEHMPTGIDTICVVIADSQLNGNRENVINEIINTCKPDTITVLENMALIATVGHGMVSMPGTAARLFTALANAKINIRMIDQGSSELNIIIGVNCDDFNEAIKAIYKEFFKQD